MCFRTWSSLQKAGWERPRQCHSVLSQRLRIKHPTSPKCLPEQNPGEQKQLRWLETSRCSKSCVIWNEGAQSPHCSCRFLSEHFKDFWSTFSLKLRLKVHSWKQNWTNNLNHKLFSLTVGHQWLQRSRNDDDTSVPGARPRPRLNVNWWGRKEVLTALSKTLFKLYL